MPRLRNTQKLTISPNRDPAIDDLTGFQRDILYILVGFDKPPSTTIRDELEDYYGTEITPGRLYPNLDALVDKGLIAKGQYDQRTNTYTLTDDGQRELAARRE